VSLIYQGASGAPHDYIYGGSGGAGDLNGDGVQGNDLFYVPISAQDQNEIRFRDITRTVSGQTQVVATAAQQAIALDNFINESPCLYNRRGTIVPRNACRNPFVNQVDLAVRQDLPEVRGQRVSVQLDVFNFGNLLNKEWGQQRVTPATTNSNVPLVTHVGYSSIDPKTAVPVVQFTAPAGGEYVPAALQTNFWRGQLSFRYSF
jgi:hypothetical protein